MMKLPEWTRRWLVNRCYRVMDAREPDYVIGEQYLRRWWLIPRNRFFNVYLHLFLGDDDDRALHDHPWHNCSILLEGWYLEHLPAWASHPSGMTYSEIRRRGEIHMRGPKAAHRIQLGDSSAITLFITGPRVREWGFWCPRGWRHWKKFTAPGDKGQIGRGCD